MFPFCWRKVIALSPFRAGTLLQTPPTDSQTNSLLAAAGPLCLSHAFFFELLGKAGVGVPAGAPANRVRSGAGRGLRQAGKRAVKLREFRGEYSGGGPNGVRSFGPESCHRITRRGERPTRSGRVERRVAFLQAELGCALGSQEGGARESFEDRAARPPLRHREAPKGAPPPDPGSRGDRSEAPIRGRDGRWDPLGSDVSPASPHRLPPLSVPSARGRKPQASSLKPFGTPATIIAHSRP